MKIQHAEFFSAQDLRRQTKRGPLFQKYQPDLSHLNTSGLLPSRLFPNLLDPRVNCLAWLKNVLEDLLIRHYTTPDIQIYFITL